MPLVRVVKVDGLNNIVIHLSSDALAAVGITHESAPDLLRKRTQQGSFELKLGAACGRLIGDRFGIGEEARQWPEWLPDPAALAIAEALPYAQERTSVMRSAGKRVPLIVYSNDLARVFGDDPTEVRERYRASAVSGMEYEALVQRIKHSDLPLVDRVDRLGDAMLALVPDPAPSTSGSWLPALHPAARRFIDSAEQLSSFLTGLSLDWSGVVITYCKALELEGVERLVEPLRGRLRQDGVPKDDLEDKDIGRIARYCVGRGDTPPELGVIQHFLATAAHSKQRAQRSVVIRTFRGLVADWPGGAWILEDDGAIGGLSRLTREFRNRAAHTGELGEEDAAGCRDLVIGPEGLLPALVRATS